MNNRNHRKLKSTLDNTIMISDWESHRVVWKPSCYVSIRDSSRRTARASFCPWITFSSTAMIQLGHWKSWKTIDTNLKMEMRLTQFFELQNHSIAKICSEWSIVLEFEDSCRFLWFVWLLEGNLGSIPMDWSSFRLLAWKPRFGTFLLPPGIGPRHGWNDRVRFCFLFF